MFVIRLEEDKCLKDRQGLFWSFVALSELSSLQQPHRWLPRSVEVLNFPDFLKINPRRQKAPKTDNKNY